jgi:hypothetical protein
MTGDVLLSAVRDARQRRDQAERDLRLLLAYAREHVTPRPYRLADLAEAAGMSISGIRTAYNRDDIDHAAQLALSGIAERNIDATVAAMLAALHGPACEHDIYAA